MQRAHKLFLCWDESCFLLQGDKLPVLSVLPMPVKVFVEIADALVKVVQVLGEHPVSHHFLLSDTTLQFISTPASKPYWALDQFFWMLFEIPCNVTEYTISREDRAA